MNSAGVSQRPPPGTHTRIEQYELSPDERTRLDADVREGRMGGVFQPVGECESSLCSPVFYNYKTTFSPMLPLVAGSKPTVDMSAIAATFASPERALAHFDERVREAVATATSLPASGWSSARATASAVASMVTVSSPRLVFDYSGLLNERLAKWPMSLVTMWELVAQFGKGWWVAVEDLQSGFWGQSVDPRDRPYMAIMVRGEMFMPTRQMFGSRNAPASFSVLSGELAAVALRLCRQAGLLHVRIVVYVDDFAVFGPTEDECTRARDILRAHVASVLCQFKKTKAQGPTQTPTLLGLAFDTRTMTVSLPQERRYNLCVLLAFVVHWCAAKPLPRTLARKMAGKLGFASMVVHGGIGRITPFWDAAENTGDSSTSVDLLASIVAAARWWLTRLTTDVLAAPLIDLTPAGGTPFLPSFSDASGDIACSITVGNLAMYHSWGESMSGPNLIACQEMYPIAWLASTVGYVLRDVAWQPLCDNAGVVYELLRGSCRSSPMARALHRQLWSGLHGADGETPRLPAHGTFLATWQPREGNEFMDAASKCGTVRAFAGLLMGAMCVPPFVVPECGC
ncbi:MAG: hypothetical protein Q7V20_03475 [Aquabacterium sp.]|uniref:reverse transcriptase domain-containing protein n=1 Tax=Aquabacterium sp. TaxID=1872578 RepID=UPI0027196FED|nr:reverse transcriptase domain-containing protein [Aquabacterium sp.]MDO9002502.1 hypothetical protein [Aquabacterium sp.]